MLSGLGVDRVLQEIVSAVGAPKAFTSKPDSRGAVISQKSLRQRYLDGCDGEEILVEFCDDVLNVGDF